MLNLNLPLPVAKALAAINAAGHEAYVVGGAVRDLLLGQEPGDYDITTSAHPEQVLELCRAQGWQVVDSLGQNFGCVVAIVEGMPLEITTFRGEAYGSDAHRPTEVYFTTSLKEDLSRRDFTINAMAMDAQVNIYDYFGGRQDLEQGILRTVGIARERYNEDALRMLRACRFVGQLGFSYQQEGDTMPPFGAANTPYYLPVNYSFPVEKCAGLSLERVRKELDKVLLSKAAGKGIMLMMATGLCSAKCRQRINGSYVEIDILPELEHLVGLHQNPKFHCYDTWEHTLLAIDNSPRELAIRWALLLHDLGKGLPQIRCLNKEGQPSDPGHEAVSAVMADAILQRLGYPDKFRHLVVWLVAQHMRFAPMLFTGERTLLRWVRSEATKENSCFRRQEQLTEAYAMLVEVFLSDMGATHARHNEKLMAEGRELGEQVVALSRQMPVATSDLAIGGKELLQLLPREQIKDMLAYLLQRVQSNSLKNETQALLQAVKAKLKKTAVKEQANE